MGAGRVRVDRVPDRERAGVRRGLSSLDLLRRNRTLAWKVVALNLLGSIAFGASAVASLVEPSSGEPVSARIANAGTSVGAICFLIGALLLMPEAANEERAAVTQPHEGDTPRALSQTP